MPKIPNVPLLGLAIALTIIGLYAALIWAPVEQTLGESYRVFYLHVPAAWVSYLSLGLSMISSILYLKTKSSKYDIFAEATAILGVIYASLTLILGSIWANTASAWGTYWNWDPRETTTLILWISYISYLALRVSIEDVDRRAVLPAVYNIFAFATVPLSYISVVYWQTLHPRLITTGGILMSQDMITTLILNLAASSVMFLFLLNLLYNIRRAERFLGEYEESTWR